MEFLGTGHLTPSLTKLQPLPFKDHVPDSCEALWREGFTIFSLGPLYVYAGVDSDILERFAADECTERALKGRKPIGGSIDFDHNVLARCELWNKRLNVLDLESYGFFIGWMNAQMFINRKARRYYEPRKMSAPVLDPLALMHNKQIAVALDLFSVSGIYAVIRPKQNNIVRKEAKHFIDFEKSDPEPHVAERGKLLLEMSN